MLIVKIVSFCLIALFLYMLLKDLKSNIALFILVSTGIIVFLIMVPYINELIGFIKTIAEKANIDIFYIGIVLKILAISYLTSFCSELCKDSGAGSIASKVEFSGKILILLLAVPILMAVLNTILKIL
ncbi:stage III sporulation protein AD [Clostridium fallax]|uniref:Stage III sporulation protein AD n=1 Tax=Clostridium fallax TaxID=1533 RepID=A0A1M4XN44_9CLOT|nr:stage III sporulation protein AD [Clostridium fallax]SHE94816.1 stage III sporulation protein AD [Clostridium fallax]SQB06340.1 stage III sporulation protein AD [Clostridium fallax]